MTQKIIYLKTALASIIVLLLSCTFVAAQPTNDNCSGSILITSSADLFCGYGSNSTAGATLNATGSGVGNVCSGDPDDDVWFKFVITHSTHFVNIHPTSGTNQDLAVVVYTNTCGSLDSIYCQNQEPDLYDEYLTLSNLTIDDTIFLRIYEVNSGSLDTEFELCVFNPVENDDCAGAIEIDVSQGYNSYFLDNLSSYNTTNSGIGPSSCGGNPDDDIWFKFTPIIPFYNIGFYDNELIKININLIL